MLLLSDEQVQELISADMCLESLEQAYGESGQGWAGSSRRTDIVTAHAAHDDQEPCHGLKSMMGVVSGVKIGAIRINSDIITWPASTAGIKRVKLPRAPGERYVALVLLFSIETGELLSLFPDASIQRMRVGATSALGAKYLSRKNSEVLGIYGSGWQAGAHLMATLKVRNIKKAIVYSPNRDRCRAFCQQMGASLQLEAEPARKPEDVLRVSDIVMSCTNSLEYVILGKHLREGVHICSVKPGEIDPKAYERADVLILNTRQTGPEDFLINGGREMPPGYVKERKSYIYGFDPGAHGRIEWQGLPLLSDVISGKGPGRESDGQITCFCNNLGIGMQFAAVGHAVYRAAKEQGIGQELPSEWFSQLNHP